jgi:uncharacterized protein YqjF (DUF2071 family)
MGPGAAVFLTAEWRYLAMLNFAADPAVLAPLVPTGTELDVWDGAPQVSLVGFRFLDTRVLGLAVPGHRHFDEVNLRFYVRRRAPEGWRRGVVFVREIVPRRAVAWLARTLYNERYVALPMRHEVEAGGGDGVVAYSWCWGGAWNRIAVRISGPPSAPPAGSEAELITEHYWGYARQRDGSTLEYRVDHPRWEVWASVPGGLELDLAPAAARCLYSDALASFLSAPPRSAFVALGSPVVVRRPVPVS